MALLATGCTAATQRMAEARRAFAEGSGTVPPNLRDCVLPIAEAQLAHAAGRHAEAVVRMRPALGGMYRRGGPRPAGRAGAAFLGLRPRALAGRRAIPPERFIDWREAAKRVALCPSQARWWPIPPELR
jgi:hypothetical protein